MALILAIGYLLVLMIGSTAFFTLLNHTMSRAYEADRRQVCLAVAEGGLNKALAELRASGGAYAGERDSALGAGTFSVLLETADRPGAFRITSTGAFRDDDGAIRARARITAEVALKPGGAVTVSGWREVPLW